MSDKTKNENNAEIHSKIEEIRKNDTLSQIREDLEISISYKILITNRFEYFQ